MPVSSNVKLYTLTQSLPGKLQQFQASDIQS